ncbi:MAG: sugar ABC transporter permease [Nitrososphaerota archaeon]
MKRPYIFFIFPSFIFLFILIAYPLIFSLYYSFQFWNLATSHEPQGFIGLANYLTLINDPRVRNAIIITVMLAVPTTLIELLLGLGIAILLDRDFKGIGIFRTLFIIPTAVAPVIAGLIFRFMFYQGLGTGIIPYILHVIGIGTPERGILGEQQTALIGIAVTMIWKWTPFFALTLLAGLQSVPNELLDAAKVDGASRYQIFRHVKLPHLRKLIAIVFIICFMMHFNAYDEIFAETRGGPGEATTTLSYLLYWEGLVYYNIGLSAALTWMIAIILIIVVNIYFKFAFKGERI